MKSPSRRKLLKQAAVSLLALPFILRPGRADPVTQIGRPRVRTIIRDALEQAPVGSTHEHTMPEPARLAQKLDIFSMFSGYPGRDLAASEFGRRGSTGMGDLQRSIAERWRLFEPRWQRARNTSFVAMAEIALRDLFGAEELNEKTVEEISARVTAANTKGVNNRILRDKARHKFIVLDDKLPEPVMPASDLFVVARRFDRYVLASTRFELDEIGRSTGTSIQTLADLERALEKDFEKNLRQTRLVTVKSTLAYRRPLFFRKVSRAEAERDFEQVAKDRSLPPAPNQPLADKYDSVTRIQTRNLQDHLFRRIVALVKEHKLPMQIHTGYQISNNVIENSSPLHLTNLFLDFPDVQFDLFHASYPFLREAAVQAKLFANVHIDMCWMQIISASTARHALREYLDTLPSTRIMGFGGDCQYAEHSYAHAVMARDNVIRVLEGMVADGDLGERQAIAIGHRILCGNAEELFLSRRA